MTKSECRMNDGAVNGQEVKAGQGGQETPLLLGLEVEPPPGLEYREHTTKRWRDPTHKNGDPLSYEFAIFLIRELGITNQSEVERQVNAHRAARGKGSIARNSIIALFNDRTIFRPGEIEEIIRTRSALLTAATLDKIQVIIDKAKGAKHLGAAAMALTAVFNVKQISHGAATRITGRSEDGEKARSFDHFRRIAEERLKQRALEEQRDGAIDVTAIETQTAQITDATQRVPTN